MARATFGGTAADTVARRVKVLGHDVDDYEAATLTVWSAQTGGTQYTDLLVNGAASNSVPVDSTGQVPEFQGPDGVTVVWVSAGGARVKMLPAEGPTDTSVAGYVNDSASSTRAALKGVTEVVEGVTAHGATPSAISAALQAAHDALPAGGGVITIPAGDWEAAATINITKPVEIRGAGGQSEFSVTRLWFAAGIKGFDVALSDSGYRFRLVDVALLSHSTAASAGKHGIHMKKGRMYLERVSAYQFPDHGFFFDTTTTGNNVNHSIGIGVRAYGNRGDGIRMEGGDSNVITLINPDVVANYGYGINNLSSHNLFLNPHADQQYNGAPGAFRDNGLSNRWEWVYSEGSVAFLIDSSSSAGYLSVSTFGLPTISTSGVAHTSWEIVRASGARNRLRTTNGTKQFQIGAGLIGTNTFDVTNETDAKNIVSINPTTAEASWYGSQMPASDAAQDFGWAGARWRDAYLSRWVRLSDVNGGGGTIYLRNNAGVLEKSTDATTWTAV